MFEPQNLFPLIALAFVLVAGRRLLTTRGKRDPATRTWLLLALIFGLVSVWLRYFQ